jgi:2-polyprenyl-3-methyl-5-hydroxy-6-metoxy-1,4-benzoquinol methylase
MSASADPFAPPAAFAVVERLASGRVLVRDATVARADAHATAPALEGAFPRHPGLACAVAKRVRADGIAAHGAFVLHPKGFVRNGRGAPRDAERFDEEVDVPDAGVAVVDPDAFAVARGDAICDPRTGYGALAMIALGLEIRRQRAGRVIAVAAAETSESAETDARLERDGLANEVARAHVRSHFGFDVDACDLDRVATSATLAGLRWNARVWGAPAPFAKYDDRGAYHWRLYASHDAYRRRADALVAFLGAHLPAGDAPVIDVGAGDALFAGLVAQTGARVKAIDPEPEAISCARRAITDAGLGDSVECLAGSAEAIPAADGSARAVLLLDVIEHLRNPVRALAEIRRVLAPGGVLLVATPAWRFGHRNDPVYHLDEYREEELGRQLRACSLEVAQTARIKGTYDDIVMLAQRA